MDNASEALQLAGWVLIFVLALSLSMSAFTQARQSIDRILLASDRDYIATYIDKGSGKTHRIVGAETIVPTIYRAYRENFKVRIVYEKSEEGLDWAESDKVALYQIETLRSDGYTKVPKRVFEIDLEDQNLGDETMKEYFIQRVLFGESGYDATLERKLTSNIISQKRYSAVSVDGRDFINSTGGLYDFIISKETSGKKVYAREELGVYFQEEVDGTHIESIANKTEKRVVTYYLSYK